MVSLCLLFKVSCIKIKQNTMLGLFKKKSEVEKLNKKYDKLMQESYELSTVNRKASDEKYAEANKILERIEKISEDSK